MYNTTRRRKATRFVLLWFLVEKTMDYPLQYFCEVTTPSRTGRYNMWL